MKRFKPLLSCLVALLTLSPSSYGLTLRSPEQRPLVQVAFLLDTSNSMDGLIEQAKSQLWKIANDLAYSTRHGQRPTVQVALYEYGNNWLSPGGNFIRQVLPFTSDLDRVSEELFSLRTNGGQEYCGAAIRDAVQDLSWDSRKDVYKVIFVAGNEPFTQGPVYFRDSIARAVGKGITVNSIFCGTHEEGLRTQWYDGAIAGHGSYLNIDSNRAIVVDPTPYDPEISRLGEEINQTYVAYGAEGQAAARKMAMADQRALAAAPSGALAERSFFKASRQYSENSWDVVSKVGSGQMEAAELQPESLPPALKSKSPAQLETHLKEQHKKRESLQARLGELKKDREAFLAKKQKARGTLSLDQAILQAVREQAGRLQFKFAAPAK
jgi:hypothetical protein